MKIIYCNRTNVRKPMGHSLVCKKFLHTISMVYYLYNEKAMKPSQVIGGINVILF